MKTTHIPHSDLDVTRLAYGNMRVLGTWDPTQVTGETRAAARQAMTAAYEAGYTLFDTADIYCRGLCEEVLGETLREVSGMRDNVIIATKCGVVLPPPDSALSPRYDLSGDYIRAACDASLDRLGVETIDLYQLHRADLLMHPESVAAAFDDLRRAGKVRHFGVSNFRPSLVAALQAACDVPLTVNQVRISLLVRDCLDDGTLDQCLERGITPLAWSPVAGGALASTEAKGDHAETMALVNELAGSHDVTPVAIALAWLMRHPSGIIPIVGSTNPDHIRHAARADELELAPDEWYRLLVTARGKPMP